jgi:hypothetical protein
MKMKFPIEFAGVDGVRVVKSGGLFIVQSQWRKDHFGHWTMECVDWHEVGVFDTVDEALEAAPELCEF